jgi:hypothetical protein
LTCAGSASAAEFTPTTFEDTIGGHNPADCPADVVETNPARDCSIGEALSAARQRAGDDVVRLSAGRYTLAGAILLSGEGKITLLGAGARETILDAGGSEENPTRGAVVDSGANAEITDLAIANAWTGGDGNLDGAGLLIELGEDDPGTAVLRRVHLYNNVSRGDGGAIANQGNLTIESSLIDGNKAYYAGGAIESWGQLKIVNSTISGNEATGAFDEEHSVGGAIDAQQFSEKPSLTIDSSTITGNTAAWSGGGIVTSAEIPTTVRNSIISGNQVPDRDGEDYANCLGILTSLGHNIENGTSCSFDAGGDQRVDPKLGPLEDNGGPTDTHVLIDGSPAINSGVAAPDCPGVDQRGLERTVGACDIGAFEAGAGRSEPPPPPPPPIVIDRPVGPGVPPGGPVVPTTPRACRDRDKPLTYLKRSGVKVTRSGVTLSGRSVDARGECASGVERVQVSLARVSGTDLNCRFLKKPNRFVLTPFRNCRKPVMFRASGTAKWSFTYKLALPPGKYRVQARGFDKSKNKETPTKRRNIIDFTVR